MNALGYETSVMVRSILLRGFDKEMASRIGKYMSNQGIRFIKESIPTKFTKTDSAKILVEFLTGDSDNKSEIFDTVLFAIGRTADTKNMGLEEVGVQMANNGKVIVGEDEKSTIDNIFAIGDCAQGRPELTPPAIMAGKILVNRLFGKKRDEIMDYKNIATTVFTPLEYGCIGYTEDEAIQKYSDFFFKIYFIAKIKYNAKEFTFNKDGVEIE